MEIIDCIAEQIESVITQVCKESELTAAKFLIYLLI